MPQLELSTYTSQAFWLVVCFLFLWASLAIFVMPKIADTIEQRKRKINEYINKAEKLNQQAKNSLSRYDSALEKARAVAGEEVANGKKELQSYLHDSETKLSAELNQKIADNEFVLAKEKRSTMQQIEVMAQDLAFEIVQKLGFSQISRQDIAQMTQRDVADE